MQAQILLRKQDDATPIADMDVSDYGSDLDEATVDDLLSQAQSQQVIADIEPAAIGNHGDSKPLARLARICDTLNSAILANEIEYDESNAQNLSPPPSEENQKEYAQHEREDLEKAGKQDERTPLQRFRTRPKKPLSVTDVVSPAWCELQYWYNLTKYGRVRRTAAMKQGSSVHKVLEKQVHTEVPVDVVTNEDRFALRIWNVMQGLRTLRKTGMTREMEVWGLVEGEVVNGIIDQVTTTCPDEAAEAELQKQAVMEKDSEQNAANKGTKQKPLPAEQRTLTDFYAGSPYGSVLEQNGSAWLAALQAKSKSLYIVDVKTRQRKSLPAQGSQLRPTHYQLMLYHRLFSTLAANGVPAERIFNRYNVDASATFSDSFIAQMATLNAGLDDLDSDSERQPNGSQEQQRDTVDILLAHNNLASLWSFMIEEFSRTVPSSPPSSSQTTTQSAISPVLTAEFRTPVEGALLGKRSFTFDAEILDAYVADELKWWRGERETKGVDVEDAYKCRICEFAKGCSWRATKIEEGIQKARLRKEKRNQSQI